MQGFKLKCHCHESPVPPESFFILSRGANSGRPRYTPNRNCFALTCRHEDLDSYYWIVYALWASRQFEPFLCGSCVLLIRINDCRKAIEAATLQSEFLLRIVPRLRDITALEAKIKDQLKLLRQLRNALVRRATGAIPDPQQQQESQPIFHL